MLSKKLIIIAVIVIVIVIALGVWLGFRFFSTPDPAGPSQYSAVFMVTGDIYYGKLSWFPWPRLKEVWFLQRGVDPQSQQVQLGIAPFRTAFWGPVDSIYLNPKQILLWTRLRNDSQVAQAFANPALLQPQAQPQPQAGPPTGDFQGPPGPPPSGGQ